MRPIDHLGGVWDRQAAVVPGTLWGEGMIKAAVVAVIAFTMSDGQTAVASQDARTLPPEDAKALEVCLKGVMDGKISPSFFGSYAIDRYGARAVPRLVASIRSEGDIREACASALAQLADRRGVLSKDAELALVEVVKAGKAGAVQATWALASICSVEGIDTLLEVVDGPNRWLGQAACMALGMTGTERARRKLILMGESEETLHPIVRHARKNALQLIEDLSTVDRRSAVLDLLSRNAPYGHFCRGWTKSPAFVALRKAMEWDLKGMIPDLRQLVRDRTQRAVTSDDWDPLTHRVIYTIHRLGGEVSPQEDEVLRSLGYLPMK